MTPRSTMDSTPLLGQCAQPGIELAVVQALGIHFDDPGPPKGRLACHGKLYLVILRHDSAPFLALA